MGKAIFLSAAGALLLLACAAQGSADDSIVLSRWLDGPAPLAFGEDLKPTLELPFVEPGKDPYLYVRILPAIDLIDGGPNIDHATSGSDRYKDAFGSGYGLNMEAWLRLQNNYYLLIQGGMTRFEGYRHLRTIDGYDYHLTDLSGTYFTIGGAFAFPLASLFETSVDLDDSQGWIATFMFNGGIVLCPKVDMYVDSSPPLANDLTGMRLDYWKARVGFAGQVALGIEYRVGPFALLVDIGVRTFGRPVPATEPRWWSAGATMITYPIRFGASYRF